MPDLLSMEPTTHRLTCHSTVTHTVHGAQEMCLSATLYVFILSRGHNMIVHNVHCILCIYVAYWVLISNIIQTCLLLFLNRSDMIFMLLYQVTVSFCINERATVKTLFSFLCEQTVSFFLSTSV